MNNFLRNMLLGPALVLCAAGSASANQLLVFVTPGQIQALAGTSGGPFGTTCNSGLTNCGVFAVGFVGASGGTANQTVSITNGTAAISPDYAGTDKWVSTYILPNSGASACDATAGCSAFMVGGSETGNTQEQFITGNTQTTTKTYTANTNDSTLQGVAPMNATTDARGMGFLLTFATHVAAGTTINVTFELLGARLSPTTGTQLSKSLAGQGTINGLTLYDTPEPSTMSMLFGGFAALGAAAWRRRKAVK